MTGTAATEVSEFDSIYKLPVAVVPTNRPTQRTDHPDVVFRLEPYKWKAVVTEVRRMNKMGRPCLVGTTSVERSETLSELLTREGIKHQVRDWVGRAGCAAHHGLLGGLGAHISMMALVSWQLVGFRIAAGVTCFVHSCGLQVLNAKPENVERESEIVAQSGRKGAVTISTNMAGRGTDILLGGNPDYMARLKLREMLMPEVVSQVRQGCCSVCGPCMGCFRCFLQVCAPQLPVQRCMAPQSRLW